MKILNSLILTSIAGLSTVSLAMPPPPDTPNLAVSAATVQPNAPFDLRWNAVRFAVKYEIQHDTSSAFSNPETIQSNTTNYKTHVAAIAKTTHYYRVSGVNPSGRTRWSNTVAVVVAPALPSEAPVLTTPSTSVPSNVAYRLTWNAVANASMFNFQYGTDPNFANSGTSTTGLLRWDDIYTTGKDLMRYYRVQAFNAAGVGPWSNVVAITILAPSIPPTVVPALSVTPTSISPLQYFTFSWTGSPYATDYVLYESTDANFAQGTQSSDIAVGTAGAPGTHTATRTMVTTKTTYYYRLKASNAAGSTGWSNVVSVTVDPSTTVSGLPTVPPMLTSASATAASGSSYSLSWNSVANATIYNFQYGTDPSFKYGGTSSTGLLSWKEQWWVAQDTVHYYRVQGANSNGVGPWSNAVAVTVTKTP